MDRQVNIVEAKAKLSELVEAAEAGDKIVIARAGVPAVKLIPISEPTPRVLGFLRLAIDDSLFDPLSETDMDLWS